MLALLCDDPEMEQDLGGHCAIASHIYFKACNSSGASFIMYYLATSYIDS